jgi:replicative superfamily II helicase
MVDFKKRLAIKDLPKITDPVQLYDTLDRASDKGPLRPVQLAVLTEWHENRRTERDVVLKLHTGQGKTLVGLLLLQAKINEGAGPAVYLCPNNFLINQTCAQAEQFGVSYCEPEEDGSLPFEFLEGKKILITSIQKLFNGRTKFGLGPQSIPVSTVLMDDAHACIDVIREQLSIRIAHDEGVYSELRDLFNSSLQDQGMGTFAEIANGDSDALLLVPYWDWRDRQLEVVNILAKHTDSNSIKFPWPLLRDMLAECQCVISGSSLEISPYMPPLPLFGSYYSATHRVFMSATVTDDSFLIRGLGLSPSTIKNPLLFKEERWSGEKMILIPSLIDPSLDRSTIVARFAKPVDKRRLGCVALVPGFGWTKDWGKYGATRATKHTLESEIEKLKTGDCERTLVVANRYDGIDLPDNACRVLIMDSKPHGQSLLDRYIEGCRSTSEVTAMRAARTVEQGLGRSVRGEKDYCAIILTGPELVKTIRAKTSRRYLSNQTRTQIDIGLEIAEMAEEDTEEGKNAIAVLGGLINQCLRRDVGWKEFYAERMDKVTASEPSRAILDLFDKEFEAEKQYQGGDIDGAIRTLQSLIDGQITDESDKGWYLQEMARYRYPHSKSESNKLQIAAHRKNRFLLKPDVGMQVSKIATVSQRRIENIISWVKQFDTYEELSIAVEDILSSLTFGTLADRFEAAVDDLAKALGFVGERPDKEWKEGPDNLWALRDNEYLLIECKSQVQLTRSEINKSETAQMNSSCAWFDRHYDGSQSTRVMIIPTKRLASAAALTHDVKVVEQKGLTKLRENVRKFFAEFKDVDFRDLSEKKIQDFINAHSLSIDSIKSNYTTSIKSWK